jgi:predicted enzyme related to lactoylglutathione lyase
MLLVHAYIEVTDPARGLAFYCEGLGLSLKRQLGPRWFELAGANVPIFLLANQPELADLGGRKVKRSYERHWTPVHLDFIVDDLDAAVARLTGLGGALDRPVEQRAYGRIAYMADPFGNGFDLIKFSGAGYDSIAGSRPGLTRPE